MACERRLVKPSEMGLYQEFCLLVQDRFFDTQKERLVAWEEYRQRQTGEGQLCLNKY